MELNPIEEAVKWLEKANAGLEPELMTADAARDALARYARAAKLASYGLAALARKLDDAAALARATGTSVGRARHTVDTGKCVGDSEALAGALRDGEISLDQAAEIAKADDAHPGAAAELVDVARTEPFHVLKDGARKLRLEAEQHRGLGARQKEARSARSYTDDLGMVNIHLALQPHIGTPIVNRAEAEAQRRLRKARRDGSPEPFERHLADAYVALLEGSGTGPSTRPGEEGCGAG